MLRFFSLQERPVLLATAAIAVLLRKPLDVLHHLGAVRLVLTNLAVPSNGAQTAPIPQAL